MIWFENATRGADVPQLRPNRTTNSNIYANKMCYTGKYYCSNGCGTVTMSPETYECGIKGFHEYEITLTRYLTKDCMDVIKPVAASSVTVGNQHVNASFGYVSSDVCTTVINCMTACSNCVKISNNNRIEVASASGSESSSA